MMRIALRRFSLSRPWKRERASHRASGGRLRAFKITIPQPPSPSPDLIRGPSPPFRGARGNFRGFTLVELLVGLTLFAMISVLLFGGFRFGLRAWESGGERVDVATRVELVQNLLRSELGQARLPRPARRATAQAVPEAPVSGFAGGAQSMTFVAPLPVHGNSGGLYLLALSLRQTGGQKGLWLAWKAYRPEDLGASAFRPEDERALLEGIGNVEFTYYGALDRQRPAEWFDRWIGSRALPQLIRIRVSFPPHDRRRWADFIVAPKLAVPSAPAS
jgi:general secretion pathway protein J